MLITTEEVFWFKLFHNCKSTEKECEHRSNETIYLLSSSLCIDLADFYCF